MKICVTSSGKDLDCPVDPRLGRAAKFIVFDSDSGEFSVVDNQQQLNVASGAGIQAASTIADTGAAVVLTGNCGPKAFRMLESCKIAVYVNLDNMTVREALEKYLSGELKPIARANVEGHWA